MIHTPSATSVEMTQMVLPGQANHRGSAFGGQVMAWIDIAAAVAAGRHAGGPVVTASVDDVHFLTPILQGHVCILRARVNWIGRTSMEVGVRVEGEAWGGRRYHATSAYTTFVALDDHGRPRPVPPLTLEGPEDERRWRDAEERIAHRRARRAAREQRLRLESGEPEEGCASGLTGGAGR
jgi:acyl-CoA hydrolase